MTRRLHYFAQPLWMARAHPSPPYEFATAVNAELGGAILARSADGVVIYRQWIDAEAGIFEDPEVLQMLGEIPGGEAALLSRLTAAA